MPVLRSYRLQSNLSTKLVIKGKTFWHGQDREYVFVVVAFLSPGAAKKSNGLYYAAPSVKHFCSSAGTKDSIDSNND